MKSGLGRGLGALISEEASGGENLEVLLVNINKIEPNRKQPRKNFSEEALVELAESIKQFGIIQPIIVQQKKGFYEIVAGERRWRAARKAGLEDVPVILRAVTEQELLEIALIENLQRENLNAVEEATTYKRLIEEFGMTQEKLGERISKSRSAITNAMRLLSLDPRVLNFLIENKITAGHGRALLPITDNNMQFELAEKIIEEELSVRATENLVSSIVEEIKKPVLEVKDKITRTVYSSLENDLNKIFGTKVKISSNKSKGKIEVEFYSNEDLDRLYTIMKKLDE